MCNRGLSLWARDHRHGLSAFSSFARHLTLAAASCEGVRSSCCGHALVCSVLSKGHSSLLGPHTTTISSLPLFHWRFVCPLHFLGHLSPFLLHQTIWSQLCFFGLNLASRNFLLRRRQLHYYQNLLHSYEYLIQLDKEKNEQAHQCNYPGIYSKCFGLWGMEPNDCPTIAIRSGLHR